MYYYAPGTVLSTLHLLIRLILSMYIRYALLLPLFYRRETKAHKCPQNYLRIILNGGLQQRLTCNHLKIKWVWFYQVVTKK